MHVRMMPCRDFPLVVNVQLHIGMLHVSRRLMCFTALADAAAVAVADLLLPVSLQLLAAKSGKSYDSSASSVVSL